MSITRANSEFMLVARLSPLLVAAGMDGTTVDGTNTDLNDPIGYAIRFLGHTVLSIVSIVDADVAQVVVADYDEFLDVATLATLENIASNLDDVDITVGPRTEKLNQLAQQVERKIKRLKERLKAEYGYGKPALVARVFTMYFAEHGDE